MTTSILATAMQTTVDRFCGRDLNTVTAMGAATVCTKTVPFRVGFRTNDYELATTTDATIVINEAKFHSAGADPGILGFKLIYWQGAC